MKQIGNILADGITVFAMHKDIGEKDNVDGSLERPSATCTREAGMDGFRLTLDQTGSPAYNGQ